MAIGSGLILIGFVCGICAIIAVINNNWKYKVYHNLWEYREPPAYYIHIVEGSISDSIEWHYEAYIEAGRPVTVTTRLDTQIDCSTLLGGECTSYVDKDNLAVEQVFDKAYGCINGFDPWECSIQFDNRYFYPKRFNYRELSSMRVEEFVPCEEVENCPPR